LLPYLPRRGGLPSNCHILTQNCPNSRRLVGDHIQTRGQVRHLRVVIQQLCLSLGMTISALRAMLALVHHRLL